MVYSCATHEHFVFLFLYVCLSVQLSLFPNCLSASRRPDMTFAVDWAFKTNYLSIPFVSDDDFFRVVPWAVGYVTYSTCLMNLTRVHHAVLVVCSSSSA